MNPGLAIILSGPSGVGKSTICQKVFAELPTAQFSVSCTTRQPRPGEQDGVHYHFRSQEEFRQLVAQEEFLEWAEVHGNFYGTLKSAVLPIVQRGCQIILDIDVQGFNQVKQTIKNSPFAQNFISVFCAPPNLQELEHRLRGRGTETEEVIQKRLHNAAQEMACWRQYDYLVINDQAELAARRLLNIIASAQLRTAVIPQSPWEKN